MEKKKILDTAPSLVGRLTYLRAYEPEDNRISYPWFLQSEPQTQTCHHVKIVSIEQMVEAARRREPSDKEGSFLQVRRKDEVPVGKLRYFNLNMLNRSAEFGYIIAPSEQRKGYGKEGIMLLARFLFKNLDLNKIYAQTGAFNEASITLLRSLNFRQDAKLREHHLYHGKLHDDHIYSLLKRECAFLEQ